MRAGGAAKPLVQPALAAWHVYGQALTAAQCSHITMHVTLVCRNLLADVAALQADYTALMYGGISPTQVGTRFDKPCPANAFSSGTFSNLFYK